MTTAAPDDSLVQERGRVERDRLSSDIDDALVLPDTEPARSGRGRGRDPVRAWPMQRPRRRLPKGWQLGAAIAGWPLWWALGFTNFVFPLLMLPLAWQLVRRRTIQIPPGFWLWALFLVLVLVSGIAIDVEAADTVTSTGFGRYLAFVLRFLNYASVTIAMLYVGNATEAELPRRRVIGWMVSLGISALVLGTLAVFLQDFAFPTLASFILPESLIGDRGVVKLAQVQPVLGETSPRPSAPFAFTNAWGNNLSLLLVWLVVLWVVLGSWRRKVAGWALLAIALVPVVYSLNRGMWIGIGIAIVLVAVRLALRGRTAVLAGLVGILAVTVAALALSPLTGIVEARLDNGHSDEVRSSLARDAISGASHSPVIGFGTTRKTIGSEASIAIGPSADCPLCGGRDIGSTGQLWLLLIAQGFLGAVLYVGFFLRSMWAYRKDHSVLGIAGFVVVVLELYYSLFYTALTMPLAVTFVSLGLLWRNDRARAAAHEAGPWTP